MARTAERCAACFRCRLKADSPHMRRFYGLEVLRRMKGDPRTQMIPVVVLTSSAEERDIVESYQVGVNSYIVKPVNFEQLAETVRQLGLYWLLMNQAPRL